MRGYKVTVTDTAAILVAADDKFRTVYINVVGNQTIAIGNSAVTFADGMQLEKHTVPFAVELPLGETIYAICDTGQTDDVRVLTPDAD